MAAAEAIRNFQEDMREMVKGAWGDSAWAAMIREELQKLDRDGNGAVSIEELAAHPAAAQMQPEVLRSFMRLLDADGDGELNFEECSALFFLCVPGNTCDSCHTIIRHHDYVTCVHCALNADNTFDLCLVCFCGRRFVHDHAHFLPPHFISQTIHKGEKVKEKDHERKYTFHDFIKYSSTGFEAAELIENMCSMQ